MAKHTRADIAEVFGVYKSTVSRAIENGALFMGKDDLIDDKHIQNQQTLKKWHTKLYAKSPKKAAAAVLDTSELDDFEGFKPPTELLVTENDTLETRKLKAVVAYKEGQVLNYKLRNAKLKGESIPIAIADGIIKSLSHHLQNQYKISAQNLLTEIAHQTKMNPEIETKFKTRLISEINKAHSTGVKNVEKELKTLLSDVAIDDDEED